MESYCLIGIELKFYKIEEKVLEMNGGNGSTPI